MGNIKHCILGDGSGMHDDTMNFARIIFRFNEMEGGEKFSIVEGESVFHIGPL